MWTEYIILWSVTNSKRTLLGFRLIVEKVGIYTRGGGPKSISKTFYIYYYYFFFSPNRHYYTRILLKGCRVQSSAN